MNLVVIDKLWNDVLSPQHGFYGDVAHCLKDIRRRYPEAFVDQRWLQDNRFAHLLPPEERLVIGESQEWAIVWGGRFQVCVAFLVRSASCLPLPRTAGGDMGQTLDHLEEPGDSPVTFPPAVDPLARMEE